jgi:phage shock protein PspC (stress-responsive transcriptional regulator)
MNEITRIHIGKVPFNIELPAQKVLNAYLEQLQVYLNDADVYSDIEQRIVELLADRQIAADGVIGLADVEAIKGPLGEPEAFLDEASDQSAVVSSKRLFRDPSSGILGGVASGLAVYLGVSVLWVRLAMVVAALVSFGWVVVLYVLLWIIVPPIRSAADKLRLEGKPVTIPAIQQVTQTLERLSNGRESDIVKVLAFCLGLGFSLAAVACLVISGVGTYAILFHDAAREGYYGFAGHSLIYSLAGLLALSGVLLSGLFSVLAYASFVQRLTKRIYVTAGVIIVAGLLSFGLAMGIFYYQSQVAARYINEHMVSRNLPVPAGIKTVSSLTVDTEQLNVRYFVSDKPTITMEAFVDAAHGYPQPQPVITVEGDTLRIKADTIRNCQLWCGRYTLLVSGPTLSSISAEAGQITYADAEQSSLQVSISSGQQFELLRGHIDSLIASLKSEASLDATAASVKDAHLQVQNNARVSLGIIDSLAVEGDTACPAGGQTRLSAESISQPKIHLNTVEVAAESGSYNCVALTIYDQEAAE